MKNEPRSWRLGISALLIPAAATSMAACFDTNGLGGDDSNGGTTSNDGDASATGTNGGDASGGSAADAGGGNENRAIDIAAGQNFGCALLASGSVWCWGSNSYGQVGQAPINGNLPPTEVPSLSGVTAIRAGTSFVCALKNDGTVACWGNNARGQLGHDPSGDPICGSLPCNATPTTVTRVSYATSLSANYDDACAVTSAGSILCWGDNDLAQLGFIGDGGFVPSATSVTGDKTVTGGVENGTAVTCFRTASGTEVFCAGANLNEALGHAPNTYGDVDSGFGYALNPSPEPVTDVTDAAVTGFSSLSYGAYHGCGIVGGGTVCWGQLGGPNGIFVENPPTHEVIGAEGATQVACGAFHTCILQGSAGDVLCWGNNFDFAVGTGPQEAGTYGAVQNPTKVGIQAVLLRGGYGQTLAIDHDGAVWQWGGGGAFADAGAQPTPRKLEGLP